MITALSLTNGTLTVIIDGGSQILTARNDNPKWTEIIEAAKQENETRLLQLLSLKAVVAEYSEGELTIDASGVLYRGKPLHTVDANRVMAFLREGLPYKPIANYILRKMKNPSARAISEMYPFLEHGNMPLTPEGKIIAYKGVQNDFYSVHGNKNTVVIQGVVSEDGRILNRIGDVIEVERSSVDDNFNNGCSFGLHAGSLAYAKGWGPRVVLVEIDPADVVSIPSDCSFQKLRCCKYKVIGEYTGPLPNTYTEEFKSGTESPGVSTSTTDCCGCGGCNCEVEEEEEDVEESDEIESSDEVTDTFVEDDLSAKVRELISEQLGIDKENILAASTPDDLGFDSLDEIEMCMAFEEEFQVEIPDEVAESWKGQTFGSVVTALRQWIEKSKTPVQPTANEELNQAATDAGVDNDDFEEYYLQGMQQGINDRPSNNPKYLKGDDEGADSEQDKKFIQGYIYGYWDK